MDTTNGPDDGASRLPDEPAGPASTGAGQGGFDDWSTSPTSPPPVVSSQGFGAGQWQSGAGAPPPDTSRRSLLIGIAAGAGGAVVLGALLFTLWPDSGTDDTGGPAASTTSPPVTPSQTETAVEPAVTVANRSVPATQVWTAMGVECEAGDVLAIAMSGSASHDQTPSGTVGPTGLLDPEFHQYNVDGFPDANTMTIIGSLDEDPGTFFVVGEEATYVCTKDGELYLGVNDAGVQNNSGAFEATITRTTHG
ncbi:hypothetical protein HP550_17665 [Cellulomonas humilata]|uniref:Uncharacterized protein n=1 Tax=Cellulomonas humilata TaxID=144055 RepID=A0A7Y6A3H0_9CELL|nr:hypothetical protein [Cellulomonas humilata]NUU19079.1 hypothetical protein [Cellulomonas humilata]